jgi:ParB/RepB/Spo0J family partition protein
LEQLSQQLPVSEIELDRLDDNPYQKLARPVINEEAIEELASSIRSNGFYGALLARPKPGDPTRYELAYGHRRRMAAVRAGLLTVPVKLMELSDEQMARVMASENFSREDLTPLGEAGVVGHFYSTQNMTADEIGEVVGRKSGWVKLRLALFQAPQDIKTLVEQKPDTLSLVPLLAQVKDKEARAGLIEKVLKGKLTRQQLQNKLQGQESKSVGNGNAKDASNVINFTKSQPLTNSEKNNDDEPGEGEDLNECDEALRHLEMEIEYLEQVAGQRGKNMSELEKERLGGMVKRLEGLLS